MTRLPSPTGEPRRRLSVERTFHAPVERVWALWTTPEGIESWWGPPGFQVRVHTMDLRPGGVLRYAMSAVGADQIAFMHRAGMPVTTEATITYTEVTPLQRLAYIHLVDFVPGHAPYDTATIVELTPDDAGVRMVVSFDAMHDDTWTGRAFEGWTLEIGKLAAVLGEAA